MRNLFVQAVVERRIAVVVTSIGLLLVSVLVAGLFPVFSQLKPTNPIIENMPRLFEAFLGNLSLLSQFETFVALQLFTIHLPLLLGMVAVWYGWSFGVRSERMGEFGRVLSGAYSRTHVVVANWAAMLGLLAFILVVAGIAIYSFAPFIEGQTTLRIGALCQLLCMSWLYASAVASFVYALGMSAVRGGVVIVLGVLLVLFSYYTTILSSVMPALAPYESFSLLHYVSATSLVQYGVAWTHVAVLAGVNIVALVVTLLAFNLRDITR